MGVVLGAAFSLRLRRVSELWTFLTELIVPWTIIEWLAESWNCDTVMLRRCGGSNLPVLLWIQRRW